MEQTIHPEALKKIRKKRGWSQKELAEKCHCSSEQVSRWERGKNLRVRSHSREKLTKAFGVSWDQLTSPPKGSDDLEEGSGLVQLNVRVDPSIRTAFQLVCLRYNLQLADVIRLAPLLFLIIAEKSLAHRQTNNDAIWEGLNRTENENLAAAPHISSDLIVRHMYVEDVLASDQDSISQLDVFGLDVQLQNVTDYDEEEDLNPFLNYLKILIADIPSNLVTELFCWPWSSKVDYTILDETLRIFTGIAGKTEAEEKMLNSIMNGLIDLREILTNKKNLPQEEYLDWLQKQIETVSRRSLLDLSELEERSARNGESS